jgi:hypothetical protein
MKCTRCKKNIATIHIEDLGQHLCLECNNDIMAEMLDVEKLEDYSKEISVSDVDKILHRFKISNMIMPGFSIWKAEEFGSGYEFEVLARPEDNQYTAIKHLHKKILTGLGYKTLRRVSDEHYISNAIQTGGGQYTLKSIGTCQIRYSDEDDTVCLVIDGKLVSIQEFGLALTGFEGFNLEFQIKDKTDEVLGKDMALKHVSIDHDVVMERFEKTLGWFLERGFLSYKRASSCEEAIFERIEELEMLYRYGDRDNAINVAEKMKERLNSIDTDSDSFPEYLLTLIDQAVDMD